MTQLALLTAVQLHTLMAVTDTLPVVPDLATVTLVGLMLLAQLKFRKFATVTRVLSRLSCASDGPA